MLVFACVCASAWYSVCPSFLCRSVCIIYLYECLFIPLFINLSVHVYVCIVHYPCLYVCLYACILSDLCVDASFWVCSHYRFPPLFISAQGPRLVIVVLRWISNAILGAPETVVAAVFLLSSFPAGQTHLLRVQTRETYTVRIDQRTHVLVIFLRTNATRPSHYLCGLVMART